MRRAAGALIPLFCLACEAGVLDPSGGESDEEEATVGQTFPEPPALRWDVALIASSRFTRPHVPPVRTSHDGRIGLTLKNPDGFFLLAPEKLDGPFARGPAGAGVLAQATPFPLADGDLHRSTHAG